MLKFKFKTKIKFFLKKNHPLVSIFLGVFVKKKISEIRSDSDKICDAWRAGNER